MGKVIRSGLGAFALLLVAGTLSAQGTPSMVFINSQRVMAEAPSVQQARAAMQQEMERLEAQITPLQQEYQRMAEDFQAQQGTMNGDVRRQRQQALMEKQQEIQQRAVQLEEEAQGKQQELLQPALEGINTVIDQLREERGYAFVFDVAAGGLVAADPALDITDEVLRRLRTSSQGS
ncbi:MAG TPA: OmpH family outer membrane protein [Longimicrobiales bacterium]|nr:OmpH family outer membrane protein [Longimicrobiales bacterium]